jgi:hypothetical protein
MQVANYNYLQLQHLQNRALLKRRARESNPQPVARQLISNQSANHSLTLRGYF